MSVPDEEPYSTIFASLKHPIRRRILRILSKTPMSFSEMVDALGVSSSFLTYHLENLGELLCKMDNGKYRLSSFGEAAITTMTKVEDIPTSAPMKTKRMTSRNVAIALGITCIILGVGLVGAFENYTSILNARDSQIDTLKAPKLIAVDLRAYDNRSSSQTPYFRIYGYIFSAGRNPALNSKLYVEAFYSPQASPTQRILESGLAFNTTISSENGTIFSGLPSVIPPESYIYIDSKIYYSGSELFLGRIWSKPAGIDLDYNAQWGLYTHMNLFHRINQTSPEFNGIP
jgi:DNA-binding transcriptional ArsR family regulator